MASALHNIMNSLYAYVAATNVFRFQETNPLSAQYVSELLVSTAALAAGGTTYYPSALGMAIAGYKDWSIDFYMLGGAATTVTLTVQGWSDDVTPYQQDITRAGYLVTNPGAGGLAAYATAPTGTLAGILDFDELNVRYARITIVTSAGANSTLRLYSRRKAL